MNKEADRTLGILLIDKLEYLFS